MRVYGLSGDPRLAGAVSPETSPKPFLEFPMTRRLAYAVLVLTSVALAACSAPTAPRRSDTIFCPNGGAIVIGSGNSCPE